MKDPEKARVQTVRVPPAVTTAVMTPALPVSFEADTLRVDADGVQSGVQIERNSKQLRALSSALQH